MDQYDDPGLISAWGTPKMARTLYERALTPSSGSHRPDRSRRTCGSCQAAARLRTRDGTIWRDLLKEDVDGLEAYEQLAIYYEHRAREPNRAAEVTREALEVLQKALRQGRLGAEQHVKWQVRLTHRLARLSRKESA